MTKTKLPLDAKKILKTLTEDAIDRAFVINAIEHYSQHVLAHKEEMSKHAFINSALWEVMAHHALEVIYEGH